MEPVKIMLDTDIGPDCDDAGALAVLHELARRGEAEIVGVTHCTSSPWGAGCIDAINAYYGQPDIPVGTTARKEFLETHPNSNYNEALAKRYPNRYRDTAAPEAVGLLRRVLSEQDAQSVVFVGIGPLVNLADLLESPADRYSELDGAALVASKVKHAVIMGGAFPEGREWNFEMAPAEAGVVMARWPTPIMLTGAEIGAAIMTGGTLMESCGDDHPVAEAYRRFLGGNPGRPSWDLTAILYAVRGLSHYWQSVDGGEVVVAADGSNQWMRRSGGDRSYLIPRMPDRELEEVLESLMLGC